MVSRGEDKYVVWPIYFDKSVSRLAGRKVPIKYSIEKPSIENIAKAAKLLGLNPVLENNAIYPSKNWKNDGRVLVDKKDTKIKLLKQISKRL